MMSQINFIEIYSASRLSVLGLFVAYVAPRGIQQTLWGLGN
jgi:hypothetical protein